MMSRIFIFLIFLIGLNACKSSKNRKNKHVFRYNEETGIATLDPAFARDQSIIWAVSQLYDGLIELDSQLQIKPALAHRWDTLEGGKTYRFYLNQNIPFHPDPCFGHKKRYVTADDVVFSFQRILNGSTGSPGAWIFNGRVDSKNPFTALNDSVVEIKLQQPFKPFLNMLAMPYAFIVPKEAIEYYGKDFRRHPVGTGPFQFSYWEEGIRLIFKKNKEYFQRDAQGISLPYAEGVEVFFKESKQVAFFEYLQGNLDMLNGLESSFKDELLTRGGLLKKKWHKEHQLYTKPYLNTEYLGICHALKGPLNDVRVRKALSLSINRDEMIRFLRNGLGEAQVSGIIPQGLSGFRTFIHENYNPENARKLLQEAGYTPQNPMPEIVLYTTKNYVDISLFIQDQLRKTGFNVRLEVNPGPTHRQRVNQGKLMLFRASWIADYPDEENFLNLFLKENHPPQGPNYTFFSHEPFELQFKKYLNSEPLSYTPAQLDSMIMEQQPVVILFYDKSLRLTSRTWTGLAPDPMNRLLIKFAKPKE